jgi:hypothetical protein
LLLHLNPLTEQLKLNQTSLNPSTMGIHCLQRKGFKPMKKLSKTKPNQSRGEFTWSKAWGHVSFFLRCDWPGQQGGGLVGAA